MIDIRTRDVFATMRPDLQLVEQRLEEAARIDYPDAAELILGLVRAGGKRLRPLILLLAARSYDYDRETLVTAAAGVAVQRGVPCVVLAGQVSVGRREAAAVGVDAAYGLADLSRDALVALAERVARRWGR